jgi:hypothetical protein
MAHDRYATIEYATSAGVDIWPLDDDELIWSPGDFGFLFMIDQARRHEADSVLGDVGKGRVLLARLPQGLEKTREKFPRVRFLPVNDPAVDTWIREGTDAFRHRAAERPDDPHAQETLAQVLLLAGDRNGAIEILRSVAAKGDAQA